VDFAGLVSPDTQCPNWTVQPTSREATVTAPRMKRWSFVTSLAVLAVVSLGCSSPGTHYRIQGDGMWPTFRDGAVAVANPRAFSSVADVHRGDVVAHARPGGGALLKRVVGIPGDLVAVRDGHVYLGGRAVRQERTRDEVTPRRPTGTETRAIYTEWLDTTDYEITYGSCEEPPVEVRVPPDHLFLLGDNRCASSDSRHFGTVPFSTLQGRVLRIKSGP
jgi:signal peptidase I